MKRPVAHLNGEQRSRILEKSAQLFGDRGVEETSLNDIAEQMRLSKATIYHYFVSKEEIYSDIVIDILERLAVALRAAVSPDDAADHQLQSYMETYAQFLDENFWGFTTVLMGFGGIRQANQRSRALRLREEVREILRDIVRTGIKSGAFRKADPKVTARAIISMLNWMARWYKPDGSKRAAKFAAEFANLAIHGLQGPSVDPRKGRGS
jgi:TetR/AcrR family transcriptional regulator, cholesterol catabolism regulator